MDTPKAPLSRRLKMAYRSLVYGSVNEFLTGFQTPRTTAGISVNDQTALTLPAWWCAVRNISGDIGKSPLCLYKRNKAGGREKYYEHPLYRLLHDEPNPEMAADVMKETMQGHILSWGNAYAEIERNSLGRPTALWPITPDRVEPFRASNDPYGPLKYRVSKASGKPDILDANDILHIPGLGYDGYQGYSVVAKARESIGLGLASEQFGETFYVNKGHIGGVFSHPSVFAPGAQKVFEESVRAQTTGVNAHNFITLQEGMAYTPFGIPPNDAQFLETRQFQVTEVARWFNIPPHKLKDLLRATFSNIEHLSIEYVTDTLTYWAVRWELECNRKLVAPQEKTTQYFKFNLDALLRGDQKSRYDAYAVGRQWGFLTLNQIAEKEDWNPDQGEYGDTYLVPANMTTSDKLLEAPVPGTTPAAVSQPKSSEPSDQSRELIEAIEKATERAGRAEQALETAKRDTAWLQVSLKQSEKSVLGLEDRAGTLNASLESATAKEAQLTLMRDELVAERDRLTALLEEVTDVRDSFEGLLSEKQVETEAAKERAEAAEVQLLTDRASLEETQAAKAAAEAERDRLNALLEDEQLVVQTYKDLNYGLDAEAKTAEERAEAAEAQLLIDRASLEATRAAQIAAEAARSEFEVRIGRVESAEQVAMENMLRLQDELAQTRAQFEASDESRRAAIEERESAIRDLSEKLIQAEAKVSECERDTADSDEIHGRLQAALSDAARALEDERANVIRAQATQEAETKALQSQMAEANQRLNDSLEKRRAIEEQHESRRLMDIMAIEAHRDLYVHELGRLVRRETAKAKSYGATQQKLRTWKRNFYDSTEEDLFVQSLAPAMGIHLSAMGSAADPLIAVRTLVRAHFEQSQVEIDALLEADPDQHTTSLDRLIDRWEQERPRLMAEGLVREELSYVSR